MKRSIPFFLGFIFFLSCSNPLQKDYVRQTSKAQNIYQASLNEHIAEIAVSPHQEQLAMIVDTKELQILNGNQRTTHVLPFFVSDSFSVSQNAQAISWIFNHKLYIKPLAQQQVFTIALPDQQVQAIKWQNDQPALLLLSQSHPYSQIIQYLIKGDRLISRQLLRSARRKIHSVDFNSLSHTLTFIGSNAISGATALYWLDVNGQTMDSMRVDPTARLLSIAETGKQIAWLEGNNVLKIMRLPDRQVQTVTLPFQATSAPQWHKNQLLLFSDANYTILDLNPLHKTVIAPSTIQMSDGYQQATWASDEGNIALIKIVQKDRLLVYDPHLSGVRHELEFENQPVSSLSWNRTGQKLLYLKNNRVQILDLDSHKQYPVNIPFEYAPIARWGPEDDWLSFISNRKEAQKQILFNPQSGQTKEFAIDLYSEIRDFSWTIRTRKVLYTIPDISRLFTYSYTGNDLKYEKAYTLVAEAVRWAPSNTELNKKIGEYAIFKGQPTLGVYFLKSNNLNWILHLQSRNIIDFDWSADGTGIYYVYKEEGQAPRVILEQILYSDDI